MIDLNLYICLIFFIQFLLLINSINTNKVRCYEDSTGSSNLVEHCRTCVIFIDTKNLYKKNLIEDLFSSERFRRNTQTIIHQRCAREYNGPLYGYNQTDCYCNTDLCNLNIQRCFYEIASKRYFSCYHGSNLTLNSLEIYKKCRSCRIKVQSNYIYHYECLTFGEQEQRNHTHCTCQHPMCNQDFTICQRFQQIPSKPRLNSIQKIIINSTQITTTTTTTTTATTKTTTTTLLITNQTEIIENSTSIELTTISYNDTNQTQTVLIEVKNHASNFVYISSVFYVIISFLF